MNELEKSKVKKTMDELLLLAEDYANASEDLCGEDDKVNTIPAKELLERAKELKVWIERITE